MAHCFCDRCELVHVDFDVDVGKDFAGLTDDVDDDKSSILTARYI
jgi:hypothetical protein